MAADRTESTPALRTPTPQEQTELGIAVEDLAWQWARRLGATAPRPFGHNTDPVLDAGAAQATAQALRLIASTAETWSLIHTTTAQGPGPAARPAPGPGEWTREQVLAHLAEAGMPVAPDTWSAYVSRGQAPAPLRRVGRTPVWDPADVRAWQDGRRGRGWRAGTGGRTRDTVAGELDAARARHRDALHAVHAPDNPAGDVDRLTRQLDEIDLAAMTAGLDNDTPEDPR